MLDKTTMEEFMVAIKNAKADNNLGELNSARTETFFAMLYSESVDREGTMRPRMMRFLRSLFSTEPLEDTLRILMTLIFDELLSGEDGENEPTRH